MATEFTVIFELLATLATKATLKVTRLQKHVFLGGVLNAPQKSKIKITAPFEEMRIHKHHSGTFKGKSLLASEKHLEFQEKIKDFHFLRS